MLMFCFAHLDGCNVLSCLKFALIFNFMCFGVEVDFWWLRMAGMFGYCFDRLRLPLVCLVTFGFRGWVRSSIGVRFLVPV